MPCHVTIITQSKEAFAKFESEIKRYRNGSSFPFSGQVVIWMTLFLIAEISGDRTIKLAGTLRL